ncbi:hypothetical protein C8R42DRAFT_283552 [Lentinula raphanica]|nr:hypothetical protein C8R42DRAFT_283552 [Lentinula raphanica]
MYLPISIVICIGMTATSATPLSRCVNFTVASRKFGYLCHASEEFAWFPDDRHRSHIRMDYQIQRRSFCTCRHRWRTTLMNNKLQWSSLISPIMKRTLSSLF